MNRLREEEDGLILFDGNNFAVLEDRDHRGSAPHTTSQATIKDTDDGSNPYLSELVYHDPTIHIENILFAEVPEFVNNNTNVYWTLTEVVQFDASEVRDFLASSKKYDIVAGTLFPVATTDWLGNSQADGLGTNQTGSVTYAIVETDRFNGRGALLRVTWGGTAGYLTHAQLRTLNAISYDNHHFLLKEDSTSKSAYGHRTHTIKMLWTREQEVADATLANRLARRKDPRSRIDITMENGSKHNSLAIIHRGISDRVTVNYSDMGINTAYFIEGHVLTVDAQEHKATRMLQLIEV